MTRSASTYDADFFAWTQEQAAALRAITPDAAGNRLDIVRVAEEIEDLGKRDLREVSSYLGRLFEHLIKIASMAQSQDVPHWRSEVRHFQTSAVDAFSPSMRQLIDLSALWQRSVRRSARDLADCHAEPVTPADCPFRLDDLISEGFEIDPAIEAIIAAAAADPSTA